MRALAADPPILLMDEPFAAIDAITRECLQEEFLEIQMKVNKTILFVTHDVEEAFWLADKIVIMKSGGLVQYGTPLEIVTQPQNEFVQELVGTGNMLRRLSLIDVQSVLDTRADWSSEKSLANLHLDGSAVVHPNDDLRSALSTLLNSGANILKVVDLQGRPVGEINFSDLRAALVAYAQLMLVRNWVIGLTSIDPSIIEAAKGVGMSGWQRFWQAASRFHYWLLQQTICCIFWNAGPR